MELPAERPLHELSSELQQSVRRVQVELLWRNAPAGYVANVLVALTVTLTLSGVLAHPAQLWFAGVLAVNATRAVLTYVYFSIPRERRDAQFWGRLFIGLTFLTGMTWGILGAVLFPLGNQYEQSLIAIVVIGITAGAVVTNGFIALAYYVYLVTALAPFIVRVFIGGEGFDTPLGVLALIYGMFMVAAARRTNRNLVTNLVSIHRLEEATRELVRAQHDQLTGLPTRSLLYDRLEQALLHAQRHQKMLAVLFVDLDGFKDINDAYGHDAGDEALRQLAALFNQSVRAGDTVSRHGGDEFVMVLGDLNAPAEVEPIVRKLLAQIAALQVGGDRARMLTGSIGVAVYPGDGSTGAELISRADAAMYRAKQHGKNTYAFEVKPPLRAAAASSA